MEIRPSEKSIQDQPLSKEKVSEKQSFSQKAISRVRGFFNRSNADAKKVSPVIESAINKNPQQQLMPTKPFLEGFEARRSFDAAQWNAMGGQTSKNNTPEQPLKIVQEVTVDQTVASDHDDQQPESATAAVTEGPLSLTSLENKNTPPLLDVLSPREIMQTVASGNEFSLEDPQKTEGLIPPDLEQGLRNLIDKDLPESVRLGVMLGIPGVGRNFSQGITMVAAAIDADLELTPSAKEALKVEIRQKVQENLPQGIQTVIDSTLWKIKTGQDYGLTSGTKSVDEIFAVAEEMGIPVSFTPKKEEGDSADTQQGIVPVLTSREEIQAYLADQIDQKLLSGVKGKIDHISYLVRTGQVEQLDKERNGVDDWVSLLGERGFAVVDEPVGEVEGTDGTANALVQRRINKAEVRQLIDEQVKANLAKGLQDKLTMLRYRVKEGYQDPLKGMTKDDIASLVSLGEQYGVVSRDITSLTDGTSFNPDLFEEEVRKVVAENIPSGIKRSQEYFEDWIRQGKIDIAVPLEKTIASYIALGKEYGIEVDETLIQQRINGAITTENVQKGVTAVLSELRGDIQKGNFHLIQFAGSKLNKIRQFAHEHGISDIDFSEVEQYMKDHGVSTPELTA